MRRSLSAVAIPSLVGVLFMAGVFPPTDGAPGVPSTDPVDLPRLLGGEVMLYQFDADDRDTMHPGSMLDHAEAGGHGTLLNGATLADGVHGGALANPNFGAQLRIDELGGLQSLAGGDFTLTSWLYPTTLTNWRYWFGSSGDLYARSSHGTVSLCKTAASGAFGCYSFGYNLPAGTWTHLAFVSHGASLSLVVNGMTFTTVGAPAGILGNFASAAIGTHPATGESFVGFLDEVRVYNRALVNSEIDDVRNLPYLYPNQPPVADAGPDQVVPCLAGQANVTLDASGSMDPDGDPLTFLWEAPSALSIGSPSSAVTAASFPLGVHTAEVMVSDDRASDTAATKVTVVDFTPPVVTSVWPREAGIYSGSLGTAAPIGNVYVVGSIDVGATAVEECSTVSGMLFEVDDGTSALDASSPFGFTYAPVGLGVQQRTLTVRAMDEAGNLSPATTVAFQITALPALP